LEIRSNKDKNNLKKLPEDSTSGQWTVGANFAIILLTDPNYGFHLPDTGKVIQKLQLSAWDNGVGSGLYAGIRDEKKRSDFKIPSNPNISAVVGFGFPKDSITGGGKIVNHLTNWLTMKSRGILIMQLS
jgi:hypothetical protein